MYVIRAIPKRGRRSGLGDVIKIASDSGKLDVSAPPVFYENGKQLPFGILPDSPQLQQQRQEQLQTIATPTPTWVVNPYGQRVLSTIPDTAFKTQYAQQQQAAANQKPGAWNQLSGWLGEEVVKGTGISKGLAVSGAGLMLILAAAKRPKRR